MGREGFTEEVTFESESQRRTYETRKGEMRGGQHEGKGGASVSLKPRALEEESQSSRIESIRLRDRGKPDQ